MGGLTRPATGPALTLLHNCRSSVGSDAGPLLIRNPGFCVVASASGAGPKSVPDVAAMVFLGRHEAARWRLHILRHAFCFSLSAQPVFLAAVCLSSGPLIKFCGRKTASETLVNAAVTGQRSRYSVVVGS